MLVKNGIDGSSVEGANDVAYAISNVSVELTTTKVGVPVLWWRVVGNSHTAYAVETFIDEVAHEAGKDPLEYRLALLGKEPRYKAVLQLAAEKSGWGKPMPQGKGRGIAVAKAFGTYVAQVAEVTVAPDGKVRVDRVVCAVDCGTAVNPDIIAAQMEGGIGFALGAILHGAITLKDGKVEQSNFDGYQVLRIDEMPKVEVHIAPSTEAPTGVGEPGVAPTGPAVANAVFAATGKRVRDLRRAAALAADLLDELGDLAFGDSAHEAVDRLAVLEGDDRRNGLDAELAGDRGMIVDVHLDQLDLAAGGVDRLFELRRQLLAGPAPRRPEVDQHRLAARFLDDVGGESRGRRVLDQLRGRRRIAQRDLGAVAAILHRLGILAAIAAKRAAIRVVITHRVALSVALRRRRPARHCRISETALHVAIRP